MLFSYNWLKDYISGKAPSAEKTAELLTFHSFEVESVEKKGNDWVFDIDVLPNRAPDCFSHLGVAREIATILNLELKTQNSKPKLPPMLKLRRASKSQNFKIKDFIEVNVENKKDCPRYTAQVIPGVKIKESPQWLKQRLANCGLQSINNVVDVANYVMLETGQPIHAFDFDKISGIQMQNAKCKSQNENSKCKKIIVRRGKKGEKIGALDDKTYNLNQNDLVIADEQGCLAIAGIKGGKGPEISKETKNIVIEAANFNQKIVRLTSKRLKLRTDASWRFESGLDPNLIDLAQKRMVFWLEKLSGIQRTAGLIDFYPKKAVQKIINLDLDLVNRVLGVKIPSSKTSKILKNLGFEVSGKNILKVKVPTRRLDVFLPEDLIEEIGRIYGYENIGSFPPFSQICLPSANSNLFWEKTIKNTLKEAGFCEVYNYSFLSERQNALFKFPKEILAELENPMSSSNRYLGPSLMPNLLENIKNNSNFFEEIKIFEVGKVYKISKESPIEEKKMLNGVLTRSGIKDNGFDELKGVVEFMLGKMGIGKVFFKEAESYYLGCPGKTAEILKDGKGLGFLGGLHPKILEGLGIKENVFFFEIDFEKLAAVSSFEKQYEPIPLYPKALRDLSVLVKKGTRVSLVLEKIKETGGELVKDIELFDVYKGESLAPGRENFSFHIVYQAKDRTLNSQELDKIQQKIIEALEENPEWEVRR